MSKTCKKLTYVYSSDINEYFARLRFTADTKQLRITKAPNCRTLTCCTNVRYEEGHERASSVLFSVLSLFCEYWQYLDVDM
jgi:hypothetical protein